MNFLRHMYEFAAHAEAPILAQRLFIMLRVALMMAALSCVDADCNFQKYAQNGNGDYPNSYYCTNRQDTWSGGTADAGGCVHWSNGLVKRCTCTCYNENGLRRCGNSYDGETSACYADTVPCDSCPPGSERRGCGCDGTPGSYRACSAGSCVACSVSKYSTGSWQAACLDCSVCGAGTYESAACIKGSDAVVGMNSVCSDCVGGYYCAGNSPPVVCPIEKYCPPKSANPLECIREFAMYCASDGLSSFTLGCRNGYRYATNQNNAKTKSGCIACDKGTALSYALLPHSETECTVCGAGKYASAEGSTQCDACSDGKYSSGIGIGSSVSCVECAKGSYASLSGSSVCTTCVAGKYLSISGANSANRCMDCAAGSYASASGASICQTCPGGTYGGGIVCNLCPVGKTTYTMTHANTSAPMSRGATSSEDCIACPHGFYACSCLYYNDSTGRDVQCLNTNCSSGPQPVLYFTPCVPCTGAAIANLGLYYCPNGVRTLRMQATLERTFVQRAGANGGEDNAIVTCRVCGSGQYIAVPCGLTSDTVCRPCSTPPWLSHRVSVPCSMTADTKLTACNSSEMAPGGICNPCPPGTSNVDDGVCGIVASVPCPSDKISGAGSPACTVRCAAGSFAPDGAQCIVAGMTPTRIMANWTLAVFDGGSQLSDGGFVGIQNFPSRGGLWRVGLGAAWIVGGDTSQPGVADGATARFGRIGGLAPSSGGYFVMTEPELGTLRRLDYDGSAFVSSTTLNANDWSPGGIIEIDNVLFIADATTHVVWRVSASRRVWRGIAGAVATTGADASRLAQPSHVGTIDGDGLVLDSRGVWSFDVSAPDAAMLHLCGNADDGDAFLIDGLPCARLHFGKSGVSAMTTTAKTVVLAYRGGVLAFDAQQRIIHSLVASPSYSAPFWSRGRLFAIVGGSAIAEIGFSAKCLCDEGLYCNADNQCVMAPPGTYAAAWSSAGPLPCPIGTAPHGGVPCAPCPLRPTFTTHAVGATNCEYSCGPNEVFSEATKRCMQGCNVSRGEYRRSMVAGGGCGTCPLGSGASLGGTGVVLGCPACPVGAYGASPGVCAPCDTAIFPGTTSCITVSSPGIICDDFFKDGFGGVAGNSSVYEGCFNSSATKRHYFYSIAAPLSGAVGLSVTDSGTLFLGSGGSLWRSPAADARPGTAPLGMTLRWRSNDSSTFEIIEAVEDESALFHAPTGATCVRRLRGDKDEIFAGSCDHGGETDGVTELLGRLGPIYGMAVMEVDGSKQVLFISTQTRGGCASIRVVSLYDRRISTYASSNEMQMPLMAINVCVVSPFRIAVPRGSFYTYYASGSTLWRADASRPVPSVELSLPSGDSVECICASSDGRSDMRVIASGSRLRVMSTNLFEPQATAIIDLGGLGRHVKTLRIGCAGMRLWVVALFDTIRVHVVALGGMSKCLAGFVFVQGLCIPVGLGMRTLMGSVMQCNDGTYGASCSECPPGQTTGANYKIACEPCQRFAYEGQCVDECPLGTYLIAGGTCRKCPGGSTAQRGATSPDDCAPCPANTYSDRAGVCSPCYDGYTSEAGSFMCVRICEPGTCAADGMECKPLTEVMLRCTLSHKLNLDAPSRTRCAKLTILMHQEWAVITSVAITGGSVIYATAVAPGGDVFYTDGDGIFHFFDDCPAYVSLADAGDCAKQGVDLLPPKCGDGCKRGFMGLAVTPAFVDEPQRIIRLVYAVSVATHNVYRFPVLYSTRYDGMLDVDGTRALLAGNIDYSPAAAFAGKIYYRRDWADTTFSGVEGWRLIGASRASLDFFDTPADIELSGTQELIVSDFMNNRIRAVSIANRTVRTILGTGENAWRFSGGASPAAVRQPLGLGFSKTGDLLLVMNTESMLGVLSGSTFSRYCSLLYGRATNTGPESCIITPNSRSCMLNRPYDVLATSSGGIYTAFANGITRIDAATLACRQVGGFWWDITAKSQGWKDGKINSVSNLPESLFNQPFKLSHDSLRGVLYIADLNNGALRRVFINGQCSCPPGSLLIASAQSCYNPTRQSGALMQCPGGQFALEGDTSCRDCSDAFSYGFAASACILWAAQKKRVDGIAASGYSYARLVAQPQPPGAIASDWYGRNAPASFSWDDIFRVDSTVQYSLGSVEGRAPWGGEFISLTFDGLQWVIETAPRLKPRRMLPGLWFPCSSTTLTSGVCHCTTAVAAFDNDGGKSPWHEARLAAFRGMGRALGTNVTAMAAPPWPPVASYPRQGQGGIALWSRFMIFGSERGFPVFFHLAGDQPQLPPDKTLFQELRLDALPPQPICAVGWPAHYECPAGYTWVAPNSSALMQGMLDASIGRLQSNIACLSCLPGTFSPAVGSYRCSPCLLGTYAGAVGSTACEECPSGTYADVYGASACASCGVGYWTYSGAQTEEACNACPPGTGSCNDCVAGQYQSQAAQVHCIACPPGTASAHRNATGCTPCSPRTYQAHAGKAFCDPCPPTQFGNGTSCGVCKSASGCNLAVDGVCGRGCGLNRYWDMQASMNDVSDKTDFCKTCPSMTLNAFLPCATEVSACWIPAPGRYASAYNVIMTCPDGYDSNAERNGCVPCAAGLVAVNGSGCLPCSRGRFALSSTVCALCPEGKFSLKGSSSCTPCDTGSFSAGVGSQACTACYGGTYASTNGASRCTPCAAGTYSTLAGRDTACDQGCDAANGMYSAAGATACVYCAGGWTDVDGRMCTGCGLGKYEGINNITKKRVCMQCDLGLANTASQFALNSSACVACQGYASVDGTACLEPPPGFVPIRLRNGGAFNITACPVGTSRAAGEPDCIACAPGSWAYDSGQERCTACPPGTFGQGGCSSCPPHTIAPNASSAFCTVCPAGTDARGTFCENCPSNFMGIEGGGCHRCPPSTPVSPEGSVECHSCPEWTAGETCSVCAPGYFMDRSLDSITSAIVYYCSACPYGTHNPMHGANSSSACVPCLGKGYVPDATRAACIPCPTGYSSPHTGGMCGICPVGTSSPDGLSCAPCHAGTYARSPGAAACDDCPRGAYADGAGQSECTPCAQGAFAGDMGSVKCDTCDENSFSSDYGAVACSARLMQCSPGEYIAVRSATPDQDNACETCRPCPQNAYTIGSTAHTWSVAVAVCPGNTTDPGYRCILDDWQAGQFFSMEERVGAAPLNNDGGYILSSKVGAPCPQLTGTLMGYVKGPTFECYIGCKFGLNSAGVDSYGKTLMSGGEKPHQNIFYPRAIAYEKTLCISCPLGACGMEDDKGLYRPAVDGACGPPCLLPNYYQLCAASAARYSGCIEHCDPPPANAWATGGSDVLDGRGACPWSCKLGYHLADDGLSCIDCADASVCQGNSVLVPPNLCTPDTHTTGGACKSCPFVAGGKPIAWVNNSACEYSCSWGYFASPQKGCIACDAWNNISCPVGTFRDVARCRQSGVAPTCVACTVPEDMLGGQGEALVSFTSAAVDTDNCSATCNTGYHTMLRGAVEVYVPDGQLTISVSKLVCRACTFNDAVPCHGRCAPGFYRDRRIASDTAMGACARCTTNAACGTGRYAPICNGTGTADTGCRDCPSSRLRASTGAVVREFVPYMSFYPSPALIIADASDGYACPMACAANHVRVEGTQKDCMPCSQYVEQIKECAKETHGAAEYAAGQPRPCDFIYAHWNATPRAPWWDPKYTPSFFRSGSERSGVCWACPMGLGFVAGDADLCALLPGFGEAVEVQQQRAPIPSWGTDVYLAFQEPRPSIPSLSSVGSEYARRRLLVHVDSVKPSSTQVIINNAQRRLLQQAGVAACPIAHYNDRATRQCASCPVGTSTYATGATSIADCKCMPGHYNVTWGCAPCPADTFRGKRAVDCAACPRGETTFGKIGSTACGCMAGTTRNGAGVCSPCPANTYCIPCWDTQTDCVDGVNMYDCFRYSVSPPGSNSILNCTCGSGLAKLQRTNGVPYCMRPPPNSVYDPVLKRVACLPGWNSTWDAQQQLVSCTLCPTGAFLLDGVCHRCPIGTYTAVRDTVGECTPCPPPLASTPRLGATSVDECGCAPPLVSDGNGRCRGCASDEFPAADGRSCSRCQTNAVLQAGGGCACTAGFQLQRQSNLTKVCVPCPIGTFSAHASNSPCTACPMGSTTATEGAERRSRCGERQGLCLPGYSFAGTGLCRSDSLLAS